MEERQWTGATVRFEGSVIVPVSATAYKEAVEKLKDLSYSSMIVLLCVEGGP